MQQEREKKFWHNDKISIKHHSTYPEDCANLIRKLLRHRHQGLCQFSSILLHALRSPERGPYKHRMLAETCSTNGTCRALDCLVHSLEGVSDGLCRCQRYSNSQWRQASSCSWPSTNQHHQHRRKFQGSLYQELGQSNIIPVSWILTAVLVLPVPDSNSLTYNIISTGLAIIKNSSYSS